MKMAALAATLALSVAPAAAGQQLYFVNFIDIQDGRDAEYREFQRQSQAIWDKHDITVIGRIAVEGSDGRGGIPTADYIEIFRIDSMDQFAPYIQDPEYQPIRDGRAALVTRAVTLRGTMRPGAVATNTPLQAPAAAVAFSASDPMVLDENPSSAAIVEIENVNARVGNGTPAEMAVREVAIIPWDGEASLTPSAEVQVFYGPVID